MSRLRIYWRCNQKEIFYYNGGNRISFEEVLKNAREGKYTEIIEDWKGPMPCETWKELQRNKKILERLLVREI